MPFEKGHTLSTGRPKGSINKTTKELRSMINHIVCTNLETIQNDINRLNSKNRIDTIINLLQYVTPKMKTIEHDKTIEHPKGPDLSDISTNDLMRLLEHLDKEDEAEAKG